MSFSGEKRESIKRYLLEKIRNDDEKYIVKTAENFGISVTSVKRYLKECLSDKIIVEDSNFQIGYRMLTLEKEFSYIGTEVLLEDKVFYDDILPLLRNTSRQAQNIWSYAFMEMMNNALEHSQAEHIFCRVKQDYLFTEISVTDDGIGIFKNIRDNLCERTGLIADYQDAIVELYKGKFTTNRECHSGEGIFFTSKIMRAFAIWSDDAIFSSGSFQIDQFVQSHLVAYYTSQKKIGTMVVMKLENETKRSLKEVFDMFSSVEKGFVKTIIPVKEVCPYGEPIARSQARRILYRLEEFKIVEFDFWGVDFMGQGFADEVFRVFQNKYPDIELKPVNANEDVLRMINHVRANLQKKQVCESENV